MPATRYKAFISYKHGGLPLAERLASSLRSYAKPLFSLGPRIFRDEDYFVPESDLPALISKTLGDSEFLILLASREAAGSRWVKSELLEWCLKLGRADRLIIVLVDGQIHLIEGTAKVDWARTDALPSELMDFITEVPLYVDLSWVKRESDCDLANTEFKKAVNRISARLRGIAPNDMLGAEVLQTRRNVRLRNIGIAALLAFAAIASASAFVANVQRDEAQKAREAADHARDKADHDADLARRAKRREEEAKEEAKRQRDDAVAAKERERQARLAEKDAHARETQALLAEERSARTAESRRLANDSEHAQQQLRAEDLELALKAVELEPTPQALRTLRTALLRPRPSAVFRPTDQFAQLVAVSRDGRQAVTMGSQIEVWDVASQTSLRTFPISATAVSVATNWKTLQAVTSTAVTTIDMESGTSNRSRQRPAEPDIAVSFTSAGLRTLTVGRSGDLHVWANGDRHQATIAGLSPPPKLAAWSQDGSQVAVAALGKVGVWNAITGKPVPKQPRCDGDETTAIAFGPGGALAIADSSGGVRIWNPATEGCLQVSDSEVAVQAIAFDTDGTLVTGSDDGRVLVWSPGGAEPRVFDFDGQQSVLALVLAPSSRKLLVSTLGLSSIWPIAPNSDVLSSPEIAGARHASLSVDGSTLVIATDRDAISWHVPTRRRGDRVRLPEQRPVAVGFVAGQPTAVFAGTELSRWSIESHPRQQATFEKANPLILSAAMNPEGILVASLLKVGVSRVWSSGGGEPIAELNETGPVALSTDGSWVAVAHGDSVSLWDIRKPGARPVRTFEVDMPVKTLALSRDGRRIAIGSADGRVQVRERGSSTAQNMPGQHAATAVNALNFTSDATGVVSAGEDAVVRVWTIGSDEVLIVHDEKPVGKRIRSDGTVFKALGLKAEQNALWFAAFSADDARILTVNRTGVVQGHFYDRTALVASARCALARADRRRLDLQCQTQDAMPWPIDDRPPARRTEQRASSIFDTLELTRSQP